MMRPEQRPRNMTTNAVWSLLLAVAMAMAAILASIQLAVAIELYPDYSIKEAKKDFGELNSWLVKNVPNVDDPKINLDIAREKLERSQRSIWRLRESSLEKAVKMLVELSNVVTCDDRTLELMRYIHFSSSNGKWGIRRIDKLFRHYGHLAAIMCENYLAGRFIDLYENCVEKDQVEQLFEVLQPNNKSKWDYTVQGMYEKEQFARLLAMKHTYQYFTNKDLLNVMMKLSKNDARSIFVKKTPNELTGKVNKRIFWHNVRYVYETYLAKPCENYNSNMEQFVGAFYAVKEYQDLKDNLNIKFVSRRTDFVQLGIFRYLVCENILRDRKFMSGVDYLIEEL